MDLDRYLRVGSFTMESGILIIDLHPDCAVGVYCMI